MICVGCFSSITEITTSTAAVDRDVRGRDARLADAGDALGIARPLVSGPAFTVGVARPGRAIKGEPVGIARRGPVETEHDAD